MSMFKSVSKAMMAMVMDKKAREALEKSRGRTQDRKPAAAKTAKTAKTAKPAAGGKPRKAKQADKPDSAGLENKLAKAGERIEDRQSLIAEAMAIHQQQSHLLDDVDPETLKKFRRMAMEQILRETLAKRNEN